MRYIMLIHDLGKNQTLASTVMGEDAADSVDHDEVLRRLLRSDYTAKRTELLPTFSQLSEADQTIIRDVINTELNLGQFIQAEAPAATLASFADSTEPVRSLYIMHTLFDIAGAVGHVNAESSLLLTSPMYNQMAAACDVAPSQPTTHATLTTLLGEHSALASITMLLSSSPTTKHIPTLCALLVCYATIRQKSISN